MSSLLRPTLIAALLAGMSGYAAAQTTESACEAPGITLLTDAEGDGGPLGLVPVDGLDLVSLSLAQPPQDDGVVRLVFTLKVGSLAVLPPASAWFASFLTPNNAVFGVRMFTDNMQNVSFISYSVAESATDGSTTGSLVDASRPAEPESNFNADGTITIVVKASDLGVRGAGDTLKGFNGGTVLTVGDPNVGSFASQTDGMPDDLSRSGSFTVGPNEQCAAKSSAASGQFGGALGLGLLLPLLVGALRRRRA